MRKKQFLEDEFEEFEELYYEDDLMDESSSGNSDKPSFRLKIWTIIFVAAAILSATYLLSILKKRKQELQ